MRVYLFGFLARVESLDTVGPYQQTHLLNFLYEKKSEYPEKTHDFWQSVDLYSSPQNRIQDFKSHRKDATENE